MGLYKTIEKFRRLCKLKHSGTYTPPANMHKKTNSAFSIRRTRCANNGLFVSGSQILREFCHCLLIWHLRLCLRTLHLLRGKDSRYLPCINVWIRYSTPRQNYQAKIQRHNSTTEICVAKHEPKFLAKYWKYCTYKISDRTFSLVSEVALKWIRCPEEPVGYAHSCAPARTSSTSLWTSHSKHCLQKTRILQS